MKAVLIWIWLVHGEPVSVIIEFDSFAACDYARGQLDSFAQSVEAVAKDGITARHTGCHPKG